jgi:hypothetical protein
MGGEGITFKKFCVNVTEVWNISVFRNHTHAHTYAGACTHKVTKTTNQIVLYFSDSLFYPENN